MKSREESREGREKVQTTSGDSHDKVKRRTR
jgi:hypothetical protein